MSTPATITCGDLANIAGPWDRLHKHDPRRMEVGMEALCHCHDKYPPRHRIVRCYSTALSPISPDYELLACCLCAPFIADVLRPHQGHSYAWMLGQLKEAVEHRDRERLDSSPCVANLDLEAAALEESDRA